jgi:uncharacterized damage-inducible protein DinB
LTSERNRIVDQLERAFEGEAWHGPSVLESLEGVTWEEALQKPIPQAHSIWEIVLHMTAWEGVVRRRLLGESPGITDDENWPELENPGPPDWARALEGLRAGHMRLRETAASVPDELLDSSPTGSPQSGHPLTRYVLLHGIIQHDLYHAGQISILKKG